MLSKKLFLASVVLFVLLSLPLISLVGASSEMWSQTYGGASSDSAEAMVQTSDGGYALAGYTTSFGAGRYDFWLVKTDASGSMEWNRTYGGFAYALVETPDGGYALAGYAPIDAGTYDFWLAKTDEYGIIPEFPSWIILPLLITASLVIIICKQKLTQKRQNSNHI
jgi:hypothetical protein